MNAETIIPTAKSALELTVQYGIQVVLCLMAVVFLGFIVIWVLKFMRDLVNGKLKEVSTSLHSVTVALQTLTDANNAAHANQLLIFERLSKDIKDGFESVHRADSYKREEHSKMIQNQIELKEFLLEKVTVICKVK